MKKQITIDELAKIANVSKSTVSKALNNKPDIGTKTKNRILKLANQHEFTPHPFGKGLKNKVTGNIGVIFCRDVRPISSNPFYSRVMEGVEAEVAYNNHNMMLQFVTENQTSGMPKMVKERQVDGLILIGSMAKEYITLLKGGDIPLVLIDPKFEMHNCNQVVMDNEHGAFLATQYLIEKGHKKIGFISPDLKRLSFMQRYTGYKKALKFHQLRLNEDFISTGGMEKGYDQILSILNLDNKPTSIFFTNDINAHYAYKAVYDLGLKIPDDISIIGFDDIDLSRMSTPQLTTVRAYKEELGSIAVRKLISGIRDKILAPSTTVVSVKLIERESVKKITN